MTFLFIAMVWIIEPGTIDIVEPMADWNLDTVLLAQEVPHVAVNFRIPS
jgi:hypothetical protein